MVITQRWLITTLSGRTIIANAYGPLAAVQLAGLTMADVESVVVVLPEVQHERP